MTQDNRSLYSISDLADQVGVPRTTITDWLGRYARFVELQTQGRRRFYTERTLSVLCKVAELRAAGRSSADIDGELERVFPVHPTVEPPDAPDGTPSPDASGTASGASLDGQTDPGQTYPVVKQENFDELYDLLGAKFTDLCDAMSAVDRKADASARRLRLMFAVSVMIIVVLIGFLALFYAYFLVQRDNTAASRDAASAIAALSAGSESRGDAIRADVGGLAGEVSGLSGTLTGMNDDLQKILADLPAQGEAFAAAIEEMRKSSGSALEAQKAQFEAQIALEKEQFAAERLKLLQQIESMQERLDQAAASEPAREKELSRLRDELAKQAERSKEVDKLNEENDILSGRIEDLRENNRNLVKELAAAKQRADAEAEARRRAEADAESARRTAVPVQNNPVQFPFNGYPGMQ